MSDLCVVTGGAGFIGSHLVEALLQQGYAVRVFDNFSTGTSENFNHLAHPPEIVQGCLTDFAGVERAISGAKYVFHLGAMASVAKSLEDPLGCHAVCATGTLHVLEAARKQGVQRVVYAGSSSAYGSASDPAGQNEETPLITLSPYASAKLTGELYCQAFSASMGLETVRLRFFNIFGPRQRADSPYSGVIALFVAAISSGRVPTVHGDGLQVRDFTYVENAIQAVCKAATVPGISGQVYNVGTGRAVTVLDLVAAINAALGTNITPKLGDPRPGDVRFSRAQIERIVREMHYQPTVAFEEGIRRTIEWYRSLPS